MICINALGGGRPWFNVPSSHWSVLVSGGHIKGAFKCHQIKTLNAIIRRY